MNPKVDFYFEKSKTWQKELQQLRAIALDCGLTEELKWGVPCYTFQKANIVVIHDFLLRTVSPPLQKYSLRMSPEGGHRGLGGQSRAFQETPFSAQCLCHSEKSMVLRMSPREGELRDL
ncbi:MAG: hypothetical protein JO301_14545 [Chitinophagaceae bacterium]|nr:hypothetical protein [Chitinophagaceae bacterium]